MCREKSISYQNTVQCRVISLYSDAAIYTVHHQSTTGVGRIVDPVLWGTGIEIVGTAGRPMQTVWSLATPPTVDVLDTGLAVGVLVPGVTRGTLTAALFRHPGLDGTRPRVIVYQARIVYDEVEEVFESVFDYGQLVVAECQLIYVTVEVVVGRRNGSGDHVLTHVQNLELIQVPDRLW